MAQAAIERGGRVLRGQVVEHGAGGGEAGACGRRARRGARDSWRWWSCRCSWGRSGRRWRVSATNSSAHSSSTAAAVDLLGPLPVEVAQRLEGAEASKAQAAFQGAALALGLLVVDQPWAATRRWPTCSQLASKPKRPSRRRAARRESSSVGVVSSSSSLRAGSGRRWTMRCGCTTMSRTRGSCGQRHGDRWRLSLVRGGVAPGAGARRPDAGRPRAGPRPGPD